MGKGGGGLQKKRGAGGGGWGQIEFSPYKKESRGRGSFSHTEKGHTRCPSLQREGMNSFTLSGGEGGWAQKVSDPQFFNFVSPPP